jgi:hypothetical protein
MPLDHTSINQLNSHRSLLKASTSFAHKYLPAISNQFSFSLLRHRFISLENQIWQQWTEKAG